ncbi:ATP-dependent helicase [Mycobacterium haemophilum]|uniref:DNA 3'-5' helicase n=1 Tax=Mycobacterium haemophilum TaxID=29311 RepID=A0A0I9VK63_9MYCO|nr:ATP-dependent DNA helicase [Mycobacterium haemophilum]KLO33547.1 ATP-dependent DNA helicase [Mycobacterium haemophilum]KLO39074.1 ATP-dependent DNA helicase [Mycobacterium haemophilum]KLO45488.1 ATP-dependent DNA helicase [Mycobacterium haemophilum]KLO56640.1 ATP-dependent DNA helicase [Mycobacterium haemophilum]
MSYTWGGEARAVLEPGARGLIRILGGPGTGKSSLLVGAAVAHIGAGVEPESVLLLTGSGRLGIPARSALTTALLRSRTTGRCRAAVCEPLVRTVHSYAYAVLRRAAERAGDAPPRLVTSAEQDAIIRELLAGDLADGPHAATIWPAHLLPALSTAGFAIELRNLLARCAERGVDALELERLGRVCRRPEWTAAGQFAKQYEQVMLLRAAVGTAAPQATTPALGAAELVGAALEAFAVDPELLAAERTRVRLLLVDDAQQLDPQAARLVRVLAAGTELALVAGDPNQAVFSFRGGEPAGLLADDAPSVTLTASHRCAPAVARAVSGVACRLPGGIGGRQIDGTGAEDGSVTVRLAASAHAEASIIADTLRRAHLIDGVPWSQMVVIVRSVPRAGARLPRGLAAAGVPVAVPAVRGPLSAEPVAQALLTVLAATAAGLDGEQALALLTGPIGRVDPVSLRQLRRSLLHGNPDRRWANFGDLLVEALFPASGWGHLPLAGEYPHAGAPVSGAQSGPLQRVRAVLDAAAGCHRDGKDPRYTLWAAWHRSGLQHRLLTASERGGPAGAQATRDLETVTALFDITDHYVCHTSGASLRGLVEHVAALQLPTVSREPVTTTEQVRVLSAHAALGHEWDVVVIAGMQDGLWPNTVPRGGVLGTQRLLDVLDGVTEDASMRAPLLAEERRLLVAAMGRARRRLLVTAVDSDTDGPGLGAALPSAFFYEIAKWATGDSDPEVAQPVSSPRVLSAAALVGRLRGVVCAPDGAVDDAARACAATQLARLANAGVPGADPTGWHGLIPLSSSDRLCGDNDLVTLTPSTLQTLNDCPLRWLAERHGGTNARDLRSAIGSVLHALIAEPDKSESQLLAELDRAWQHLPFDAQWHSVNELARHRAMIQTFVEWRAQTRHELTEVGVEVDVDGMLGDPRESEHQAGDARLRGRVDRLERDSAGRLVIVDIKTGKTPVSKDDAQQHAQLAMYQLAVADGMFSAGPASMEPGGARLVYLGRTGPAGAVEREQDPLTPADRDHWRNVVRQAANATAGPQFIARRNDGCAHCPIRPCCPAHGEHVEGAAL